MQYSTMQYSTVQCNITQYYALQYSTVQQGDVQPVGRLCVVHAANRETVWGYGACWVCEAGTSGTCRVRAHNKGLQSGLGQPTVTLSFVATVQLNSVHESGRREMQTDRQTQADTQTGTQTQRQKKGEGSTTASLNASHKYNLSIP